MKRLGGFALIELVIVIAIGALVLGYFVSNNQKAATARAQDRVVGDYVTDLGPLIKGAKTYAAANMGTWPADTVQTITIAQLVTSGNLPANFAARDPGTGAKVAGTSPLGNTYAVRAMKVTGQASPRVVVAETLGSPPVTRESYGLGSVAADQLVAMLAIKQRVGRKLSDLNLVPATLASGSTIANGAGGNPWTKDITTMLASAPVEPSMAVLSGYPDLDPPGGDGGGTTGGLNIGKCRAVQPTCTTGSPYCDSSANIRAAQLPTGRSAQGQWPHCMQINHSNTDTFYPVAQNSAVMTLGFSTNVSPAFTDTDCAGYANANAGYDQTQPTWKYYKAQCMAKTTTYYYTDVFLNNGKQYSNICGWESFGFYTDAYGNYAIGRYYNYWADAPPNSNDVFACE